MLKKNSWRSKNHSLNKQTNIEHGEVNLPSKEYAYVHKGVDLRPERLFALLCPGNLKTVRSLS